MPLVYLDSSIALRTILAVPGRDAVRAWLGSADLTIVSSRLMRTEVLRVLRREGIAPSAATPLLDRVGLIDLSRETHAVAESIERHVRTLDALHLATAVLLGSAVVATHDARMAEVAGNLGLSTLDPAAGDADGRPVARLVPIRADILGELEDRGELRPARYDWDDFPSPDPSDVTTDEILADLRREW